MSIFIDVTPFMYVDNLDRALAFFTDILGLKGPSASPTMHMCNARWWASASCNGRATMAHLRQSAICVLHRCSRRPSALCRTQAEA